MTTAKTFTGLVLKEADTAFWVAFPDFACCFTCGDTLAAAAENAGYALQTHIDGLVAAGFRIPEPRSRAAVLAESDTEPLAVLSVKAEIPAQEATNKIIPLPYRPGGNFKL